MKSFNNKINRLVKDLSWLSKYYKMSVLVGKRRRLNLVRREMIIMKELELWIINSIYN